MLEKVAPQQWSFILLRRWGYVYVPIYCMQVIESHLKFLSYYVCMDELVNASQEKVKRSNVIFSILRGS